MDDPTSADVLAPDHVQAADAVTEARRALRALYVAVPADVARDVEKRVEAVLVAVEAERERIAAAVEAVLDGRADATGPPGSGWVPVTAVRAALTSPAPDALAQRDARVLREAADELPAFTEGVARVGTASWPPAIRDAYSLAIEEAQDVLRDRADRIARGES